MPLTISVGSKGASAALTEFNVNGAVVPAVGPVTFVSDNPSVASVSGNQITAVAAGVANITGTDTGSGVSATDVLTVVDPPVSGRLDLTANV